jgi:hypothetical protein
MGAILSTILNALPTIIGAIKHVESTDTTSDPGTKAQKAVDLATTSIQTIGAIDPAVLTHPDVQKALTGIVSAVQAASTAVQTVTNAHAAAAGGS